MRRSAFEAVGGFNEGLITGEDAELGQRLNLNGHRIWESNKLHVLHLDNPQTMWKFFKKEVWHAEGMFGTARLWPPDRPIVMTFMHLILLLSASLFLWLGPAAVVARIATAFLLASIVPVSAVLYRAISGARTVPWLQAMMLYEIYFMARIAALGVILQRRVSRALRPKGF